MTAEGCGCWGQTLRASAKPSTGPSAMARQTKPPASSSLLVTDQEVSHISAAWTKASGKQRSRGRLRRSPALLPGREQADESAGGIAERLRRLQLLQAEATAILAAS